MAFNFEISLGLNSEIPIAQQTSALPAEAEPALRSEECHLLTSVPAES